MKFKLLLKPLLLMGLLLVAGISEATTNQYRIMWHDDPTTTMVIGWNQISGSNPVVHYGTSDEGTNANAYDSVKAPDESIPMSTLGGGGISLKNTFARLSELQPNTAYYFVIKDSEGTSERFWFKTAPDVNTERLSFIAGGDSRNHRDARVNANKLVAKLRPHAVLFGGDYTNNGSLSEWVDWLDDWQHTIGADGRIIPIVVTFGNHERVGDLRYFFDAPNDDVYYALTFGGNLIRTYTLNTEITISGDQTDWLASDLAANDNVIWKTAQYHRAIRPHWSGKKDRTFQYDNWAPLFEQHSVRLVVECHSHVVKTTWPVVPSSGVGSDEGFIRDDCNGTVFVGEGCWGAPLRINDTDKSWTRASGAFNQFKWIFVDRQKIEVRTINVNNADAVGQVSDNNIFKAPANLDIWNPTNGSLVTITGGTGFVCDDGDVCTINDKLDANCDCTGTFQDTDGDSVCDANDQCPGDDDTVDNNNNGIPDCKDCPVDLVITNADVPGSYEVSNSIETDQNANVTVNASEELTLSARAYVELHQGFGTQPGANFHAYIEGCTLPSPKMEQETYEWVKHYPNPFKTEITLELNLDKDAETKIRITDVTGSTIHQTPTQQLSSGNHNINLNTYDWIPGTYFYQVFIKENNTKITKRANGVLVKI